MTLETLPLRPPGEQTGFSNPRSYLKSTLDCCQTVSREHLISKAILQDIVGDIYLSGARWMPQDVHTKVGLNTSTARILCIRHNNALSLLDTAASRMFRNLRPLAFPTPALPGLTDQKRAQTLSVNGFELEAWMVKTAANYYFSNSFTNRGDPIRPRYTLDGNIIKSVLSGYKLGQACGLWVVSDRRGVYADGVDVYPFLSHRYNRLIGVTMRIRSLSLACIFDQIDPSGEGLSERVYRPQHFTIGVAGTQSLLDIRMDWGVQVPKEPQFHVAVTSSRLNSTVAPHRSLPGLLPIWNSRKPFK